MSDKIWGLDKEIEARMVYAFRNTFFDNEETLGVLLTLLELMHFFDDDIETDEERILSNFAKKLLIYCGVWWKPNGMSIVRGTQNDNRFDWLRQVPLVDLPTENKENG